MYTGRGSLVFGKSGHSMDGGIMDVWINGILEYVAFSITIYGSELCIFCY